MYGKFMVHKIQRGSLRAEKQARLDTSEKLHFEVIKK